MCIGVCGAICSCSFGSNPSSLMILPNNLVFAGGMPVASIVDIISTANILPFGMCSSMANPTVSAATTAATAANLGVFTLTPMPCVPAVISPWIPKKTTVILPTGPVISVGDICNCSWAGVITITTAGQITVI